MLPLFALFLALMQSQEIAPGAFIEGADVEATMNRSIANNTLDTKVKEAAVKGGIIRVKPNDMVIVPAGSPHRFTQLDGPISYVIYRFEPVPAK